MHFILHTHRDTHCTTYHAFFTSGHADNTHPLTGVKTLTDIIITAVNIVAVIMETG